MAAINKTPRRSPQFCRPSVRVTHLRLPKHFCVGRYTFQQIDFFGEVDDDKKSASFSPEFLVLTRIAAGAPDTSVDHDDMSSVAPGFLKNQAFAGANAAGIRDELQS
jgi:hypothetical protein